jgi:metallo-beta-lactamase family protein
VAGDVISDDGRPISGWTLRSAGACEGVTGSAHLLTTAGHGVLVDAGMFQGVDAASENVAPWPFEPRSIDAVVVTHGHLDHVGRLPKLVAEGYRGPVYGTAATLAVAEVALRDTARILAEDAHRTQRKLRRAGRDSSRAGPLFAEADVDRALALARPVAFGEEVEVGHGVRFALGRAGHVLGAAWVVLDGPGGRVVASGDLGDADGPLHPPPEPPPRTDALLIESTYADRRHRDAAATAAEFAEVVARTLGRGGNVLIPTFALERTQAVLHTLQRLERTGALPASRVVLDAPMGGRMTELYRRFPETLRRDLAERLASGDDPFEPAQLRVARTGVESRALNHARGAIIVAGAGMMTGGRILHHLKHHLWDERSSLVVVGFQAEGTLGRRLVDGARRVRVLGETVAVAAEVVTINGFSAHADAPTLDAWWAASGAEVVVPVHGEAAPRVELARRVAAARRRPRTARLGIDLIL